MISSSSLAGTLDGMMLLYGIFLVCVQFYIGNYRSEENCYAVYRLHHQRKFSVSIWIWVRIVENYVVGPYLLTVRLDGSTAHWIKLSK